ETHILQVGGLGNLPTGEEGNVRLARDVIRKKLEAKQLNHMIGMGEPLTMEEQEQLSKVAYEYIATSLDSLSLQAVDEYEEGVQRKRLYVANGTAGISRLNLDEQNGMQLINEIGGNDNSYLFTDLIKQGNSLFTAVTAASGMSKMVMPLCNGEGDWQGFRDAMHFSYINAADPVQLPDPALETGAAIALKGEWLLGGGVQGFSPKFPRGICGRWKGVNAARVVTGEAGALSDYDGAQNLTAVNLLDPVLTRSYAFDAAITDIAYFDHYLVVALGEYGVELLDMDSDERIRISTSAELQDVAA